MHKIKFFTLCIVLFIALPAYSDQKAVPILTQDYSPVFPDLIDKQINIKKLDNTSKIFSTEYNDSEKKESQTEDELSELSSYVTLIGFFSSLLLAVTAVLIGGQFVYNHNKHEDLLKKLETEGRKKLDTWFNNITTQMRIQMPHYLKLEKILVNKKPTAKEIYASLTALALNPLESYELLFKKIIKLDIHPEVTKLAKDGLDKLDNIRE